MNKNNVFVMSLLLGASLAVTSCNFLSPTVSNRKSSKKDSSEKQESSEVFGSSIAEESSSSGPFSFQYSEENDRGNDPVIDEENMTVEFGMYPQTRVRDDWLLERLNSLSEQEYPLGDWYGYQGHYYAKVIGKITDTKDSEGSYSKKFSNGDTIEVGATYWFNVEPILWDIIDIDGDFITMKSRYLLDTHWFDDDSNNYKESDLRRWLNEDFYDAAFVKSKKSKIVVSHVDNSPAQTDADSGYLCCEDTYDKIYVQSFVEMGGNVNNPISVSSDSRYFRELSDYCFATGAYKMNSQPYPGLYWLRSPSSLQIDDSVDPDVWYMLGGRVWHWDVFALDIAVNPVLTIHR